MKNVVKDAYILTCNVSLEYEKTLVHRKKIIWMGDTNYYYFLSKGGECWLLLQVGCRARSPRGIRAKIHGR